MKRGAPGNKISQVQKKTKVNNSFCMEQPVDEEERGLEEGSVRPTGV